MASTSRMRRVRVVVSVSDSLPCHGVPFSSFHGCCFPEFPHPHHMPIPHFGVPGTVFQYLVRLIVEDDGGVEAVHVNRTAKLLEEDGVHFLIGGHARTLH